MGVGVAVIAGIAEWL